MIQNYIKGVSTLTEEYTTDETTLFTTTFPSLPANFVASGWSISGGLKSPASGGFATRAYLNKYSTPDRQRLACLVQIDSLTSIFGLFKQWTLSGTLIEINCVNRSILAYAQWDTENNTPTPAYVRSFNFEIVSGRQYECTLERIMGAISFQFRDTVSGSNIRCFFPEAFNPFPGSMWGNPGVMFRQGDITVKSMTYKALAPQAPKAAIYGDSFVDGFTMRDQVGGHSSKWAAKVWEALKGDCLLAGKGGEDTTSFLPRMDLDVDSFNPTYAIIALGTNDSLLATYQANINTIIARVEARGATAILTTMIPRADRQAFLNSANSWVRGLGRPYIDFAADSVAVLSDGIHPTVAGHQTMFNRLLAERPEIFL